MNGKAAKFQRKEIRRAIGEHGISQLDQQASLTNTLVAQSQAHASVNANHANAIHQLQISVDTLAVDIAEVRDVLKFAHEPKLGDFSAMFNRPLWGRLTWLILGR